MYVHAKARAAIICHPRTASSSLGHMLRNSARGFEKIGNHHSLVPEICDQMDVVACVLRNPLDLLVSWYYYHRKRIEAKETFQDFLYWFRENPNIWVQYGLLYGIPYCNYTMRFECIQQDLTEFCRKIGVAEIILPERNVSRYREKRPWHEFYEGIQVPEFKLMEPRQDKEIPV